MTATPGVRLLAHVERNYDRNRKLRCFVYKYHYSKVILLNNVENGHVGTLLMLRGAFSCNLTAIEAEL
jgi:hypothetical protein